MQVTKNTPNAARCRLNYAIRTGKVTRPDKCELCFGGFKGGIVGHHWRGYNFPLDVWWICFSCNAGLRGAHDGIFNMTQARAFLGIRFQTEQERDAWELELWSKD